MSSTSADSSDEGAVMTAHRIEQISGQPERCQPEEGASRGSIQSQPVASREEMEGPRAAVIERQKEAKATPAAMEEETEPKAAVRARLDTQHVLNQPRQSEQEEKRGASPVQAVRTGWEMADEERPDFRQSDGRNSQRGASRKTIQNKTVTPREESEGMTAAAADRPERERKAVQAGTEEETVPKMAVGAWQSFTRFFNWPRQPQRDEKGRASSTQAARKTVAQTQQTGNTGASFARMTVTDVSSLHQLYRNKGKVKCCFGRRGNDAGCFSFPSGLAVTADDNIVVADFFNHRIQIFDVSGCFLRYFGKRGTRNGEFNHPCDVCVTPSSQILVADTNNNRIQVFSNEGLFVKSFGEGELTRPLSVAVNFDGSVIVADVANTIKVFSSNGDLIRTFGESWLDSPGWSKYVAVTRQNQVIVSEWRKHRIGVFNEVGQLNFEFGSDGSDDGQFKCPSRVTSDQLGNIIAADHWGHRVQVFDQNGSFISSFGSKGSEPGQLCLPEGVAVLKNNDIVVSDSDNDRIQIF